MNAAAIMILSFLAPLKMLPDLHPRQPAPGKLLKLRSAQIEAKRVLRDTVAAAEQHLLDTQMLRKELEKANIYPGLQAQLREDEARISDFIKDMTLFLTHLP